MPFLHVQIYLIFFLLQNLIFTKSVLKERVARMSMGCRLQCAGGGDGRPRRSSGRGGGQNQRT